MNKKLRIAILLIASIFFSFTQVSFGQSHSKEIKKTLKEFKKTGFVVYAGSRSSEVILQKNYEKLDATDGAEIVGVASNCKSTNICKQAALNSAQNQLARHLSSKIQGQIGSVMNQNGNRPDEEIDKMVGALTNSVTADISGCLEYSFSTYKEDNNGNKEYKSYFIVNKSKLRQNLERSLQETQMTIDELKTISDFVNASLDELKQ